MDEMTKISYDDISRPFNTSSKNLPAIQEAVCYNTICNDTVQNFGISQDISSSYI